MKRTCRRRTFAQIRAEEHTTIGKFLDGHAEKCRAAGMGEAAAVVAGLASTIQSGLVEREVGRGG